jgi:hypothetical protein
MVTEILNTTLSPNEEQESGYFPVPDGYAHHSLFTVITGADALVSATLRSSPTPDNACDPDDETVYSNSPSGKRRDIVALDPADYGNVLFRNNGVGDASVRAWFCMKK